jgi:hypothetical protein
MSGVSVDLDAVVDEVPFTPTLPDVRPPVP